MPGILNSQELRAVSEAAKESSQIAITSMSTEVQHVTTRCLIDGEVVTRTATLPPNGSVLIRACESDPSFPQSMPEATPTGISIFSDGPNGGFAAFGIASHRNEQTGTQYFGAMQFIDPRSMNSSSLLFTGVSSGQSLTPPVPGEYSSFLILANFSSTASTVKVTTFRTSGTGKVASSSQEVEVGPQSATQVALGSLSSADGDVVSVLADADASVGEVFGKIISIGNSPPYQIEQLTKDAVDQRNGGSHPWTIADDATSDLILFNHSSQSRVFNIAIDAGAGFDWAKQLTLAAFESRAISIGTIVTGKVADDRKRTLPTSATSGTVIWQAPAPGIGSGRVLIRSPLKFAAQSFSCGQAYVLCDGFLELDSPLGVGEEETAWADAVYCVDYTGGMQCFGDPGYTGSPDYATWSSSNSSIATAGGGGTNPSAVITGVAPGTATIRASMFGGFGCTADASAGLSVIPRLDSISPARGLIGSSVTVTLSGAFGNSSVSINAGTGITATVNSYSSNQINATFAISSSATAGAHSVTVVENGETSSALTFYVQVPTSLSVISVSVLQDGVGAPYGCGGSANYGIKIDILYQVIDQSGSSAISSSQMVPHESGTLFSGTPYDNDVGPVAGYPTSDHRIRWNFPRRPCRGLFQSSD